MSVDLYEHPTEMLNWFTQPAGIMFLAQAKDWLEGCRDMLEKASDEVEIYRLQGRIEAFKTITNMPADIRRLEQDKLNGRRKP